MSSDPTPAGGPTRESAAQADGLALALEAALVGAGGAVGALARAAVAALVAAGGGGGILATQLVNGLGAFALGGLLGRHERLDLCISHGGGATSWLAERLAHAAASRSWGPAHLGDPGALDAALRRLWWDAHVGGPRALGALAATVGTDHLVGGTNFAGWDQHLDPAFGDVDLALVLDANARRLLRLAA